MHALLMICCCFTALYTFNCCNPAVLKYIYLYSCFTPTLLPVLLLRVCVSESVCVHVCMYVYYLCFTPALLIMYIMYL